MVDSPSSNIKHHFKKIARIFKPHPIPLCGIALPLGAGEGRNKNTRKFTGLTMVPLS